MMCPPISSASMSAACTHTSRRVRGLYQRVSHMKGYSPIR